MWWAEERLFQPHLRGVIWKALESHSCSEPGLVHCALGPQDAAVVIKVLFLEAPSCQAARRTRGERLQAVLGKGKCLVNGSCHYNQPAILKAALVPSFYELVFPISEQKPGFLSFPSCVCVCVCVCVESNITL